MNFLANKDQKNAAMFEKANALERRIEELIEEITRDNALLDLLLDPHFEKFVSNVLVPEKARLAEKRMRIPIADTEAHLLITGQWNEAEILSRGKESVQAKIDDNTVELASKRDQLAAIQAQIRKIKE